MKRFRDYKQTSIDLIEAGGGEVSERLFVEKPGVLLLSDHNGVTDEAMSLFERLNLDTHQSQEELLAQFAAIITYLSAPGDPSKAEEKAKRLHENLKRLGHRSPYKVANKETNILVAGLSVETMLELACHSRLKIGRICSSRTAAMDDPLFRVPEGSDYFRDQTKGLIRMQRDLFNHWASQLDLQNTGLDRMDLREMRNMGHSGYKAGYQVIGASPQDWHQILIGRLDTEGVELELRKVCERICEKLRVSYPEVIKTVAEYYATNPNAKEETA